MNKYWCAQACPHKWLGPWKGPVNGPSPNLLCSYQSMCVLSLQQKNVCCYQLLVTLAVMLLYGCHSPLQPWLGAAIWADSWSLHYYLGLKIFASSNCFVPSLFFSGTLIYVQVPLFPTYGFLINWQLSLMQGMHPEAKYSHTTCPFKKPAYFNNKDCFCLSQTEEYLSALFVP